MFDLQADFFDRIYEKIQNSNQSLCDITDDELYMYLLSIRVQCIFNMEIDLSIDTVNLLLTSGILSKKQSKLLLFVIRYLNVKSIKSAK